MRIVAPLSICLAATLAGCVSGNGRYDGVTTGAGNAIAANTAMLAANRRQRAITFRAMSGALASRQEDFSGSRA